jgi:hypothetical protein
VAEWERERDKSSGETGLVVMSERDGHSSGEPGMKNKSSAETDW